MKNLLFILCAVLLLASCSSNSSEQLFIEKYSEQLIGKYPNYESNEIARKAINDSIAHFCESYVGKDASFFKGVHFRFLRLIENEQKGTHAALFESTGLFCEIESEAGGGKYVIANPVFAVLGTPDEATAATLSSGEEYYISGTIHAWDGDHMIHYPSSNPANLDFGTVIMESINVSKAEKQE